MIMGYRRSRLTAVVLHWLSIEEKKTPDANRVFPEVNLRGPYLDFKTDRVSNQINRRRTNTIVVTILPLYRRLFLNI
jgi:hypothetical protein